MLLKGFEQGVQPTVQYLCVVVEHHDETTAGLLSAVGVNSHVIGELAHSDWDSWSRAWSPEDYDRHFGLCRVWQLPGYIRIADRLQRYCVRRPRCQMLLLQLHA